VKAADAMRNFSGLSIYSRLSLPVTLLLSAFLLVMFLDRGSWIVRCAGGPLAGVCFLLSFRVQVSIVSSRGFRASFLTVNTLLFPCRTKPLCGRGQGTYC
jgi:hypothetical protein